MKGSEYFSNPLYILLLICLLIYWSINPVYIVIVQYLFFYKAAAKSELWPLLLSSMKMDAAVFIDQHLQTILPLLLEGNTDNQV